MKMHFYLTIWCPGQFSQEGPSKESLQFLTKFIQFRKLTRCPLCIDYSSAETARCLSLERGYKFRN